MRAPDEVAAMLQLQLLGWGARRIADARVCSIAPFALAESPSMRVAASANLFRAAAE